MLANALLADHSNRIISSNPFAITILVLIIIAIFYPLRKLSKKTTSSSKSFSTSKGEHDSVNVIVVKKPGESIRQVLDAGFNITTESLLDKLPNIIWLGDKQGNRFWFNQRWQEFTGQADKQTLQHDWLSALHPDDKDLYSQIQHSSTEATRSFSCEYRLLHRDGAYRAVIDFASPMYGEDSQLIGYIGLCRDISEREFAYKKIAVSEEKFSRAFHASPEVIGISRLSDGEILEVNRTFESVMEYEASEVKGKTIEELGFWEDLAQRDKFRSMLEAHGELREEELIMRTKTGKQVIFMASVEILEIGGERCILTAALDVTARKKMELDLRQSRSKLQQLAELLTQAEENERRRIAVDLHDNVAQNLGLMKIFCGKMSVFDLPDEVKEILKSNTELVAQTISSSRSLIHELSPPVLNELGFEAALKWLAEQMSQRYELDYTVTIDTTQGEELRQGFQTSLFRIARELMTNAGKHSGAQNVKCSFSKNKGYFRLSIADDGCGFSTTNNIMTDSSTTSGFGLFSIKQSLEQLKGEMLIESKPGEGTRVSVDLPM